MRRGAAISSSAAPNGAVARACRLVPAGAAASARCAAYKVAIRATQASAHGPRFLRWASPARMNRRRMCAKCRILHLAQYAKPGIMRNHPAEPVVFPLAGCCSGPRAAEKFRIITGRRRMLFSTVLGREEAVGYGRSVGGQDGRAVG